MKQRLPSSILICLLLLAGCSGGTGEDSSRVSVAVPFYALEYLATLAGGEHVDVINLTAPGTDPHSTELTPQQMGQLADADLVLHLAGFQPSVDNAIEQAGSSDVIDVADLVELHSSDHEHEDANHSEDDDHDHGPVDPHFWTDPQLMAQVLDQLAEELGGLDEDNAAAYRAHAEEGRSVLEALDADFTSGLEQCERREFIPSHAAFSYLAERYDLVQISVAGLSPDEEPSPARIAEIQAEADRYGITTVFFEPGGSDAIAESIAGDLGLEKAYLDPLEGITDASAGDDYPSVMRANLEALRGANGCTG